MVWSVNPAGRWRWERLLLLVPLMLGVLTMHALVADAGTRCADSPTMAETMAVGSHVGPADSHAGRTGSRAGHTGCDYGSMPASHDLLHLCLAVLAVAVVLGLGDAAAALVRRGHRSASGRPAGVVTVQPRPPPRTAVRLAQLCVLRN
jgi:hypothetical protein